MSYLHKFTAEVWSHVDDKFADSTFGGDHIEFKDGWLSVRNGNKTHYDYLGTNYHVIIEYHGP